MFKEKMVQIKTLLSSFINNDKMAQTKIILYGYRKQHSLGENVFSQKMNIMQT